MGHSPYRRQRISRPAHGGCGCEAQPPVGSTQRSLRFVGATESVDQAAARGLEPAVGREVPLTGGITAVAVAARLAAAGTLGQVPRIVDAGDFQFDVSES